MAKLFEEKKDIELDSLEEAQKQEENWKAPGVSTWISEKKGSAFDYELFQLSRGKFEEEHIFNLGKPGEILRKCGFPNEQKIELSSRTFLRHNFRRNDISGLDKALHKPIAVFVNGNNKRLQNVIVENQKDGKNFLVGVCFDEKRDGLEVTAVRGLINMDNIDWIRWIEQGKMIYGNKEKIQALIAQQRIIFEDVKELRTTSNIYFLESVERLIQKFGNVNHIFTKEYDFYKERREEVQRIYKAFEDIYTQNYNSQEEYELTRIETNMMAEEFYIALKKDDKKSLLKYADGKMYPEIAEKLKEYSFIPQEQGRNSSQEEINIDSFKNCLKKALNENAKPLELVDFTRENYNKLFPYGKIDSPIENVKLGEHQFEKLDAKERQHILKAVYDVLKTPHIIINEERETVFGDKKPSHVYAKSFEFNGKNKAVQSIVVAIEDDNVSISTHQREINNLINKIKMPDQVIYLSPEIGQVIERMTKTSVTVNPTRENKTVPPTKNIALSGKKSSLPSDYNKQIWNDYISAVRVYLPKEKLNDRKAVLEASKNALAIQADVTGAIGIINNEFSKRGVKSSATLVKAIKETAYPELKKKKSKDDDFGHGR